MPTSSRLDQVFSALSDPSRRAIVERLAQGEATVGTVAQPLRMKLPSVSKHIKVLETAGLIEKRLSGREHWLRLTPVGWRSATEWLARYSQFWTDSIDKLEELVEELERQPPAGGPK